MGSIKTTCAYCGVGCGIKAEVTGPRSVLIKGDENHPANHGALCSKGTHLGETVGLNGRLLHPTLNGDRASWDEATSEVAARMQACIDEHGPDSVGFYVSGQLLTEDYYVANKLMKGFIGSGNIDTNSRLCMASAVAAHNRAFGEDVVPCTYDDLDHADLILLVGSNTAWCHPVIWQRIERARERQGTKLVVIDPRRTETGEGADLHLPIEPDGDVALFDALLASLDALGLIDRDALKKRCDVPDSFWPTRSTEHGIDPVMFERLLELVKSSDRMITLFSQGANQSRSGTDKGNAIINLHLATDQINRCGAGPFSITGQPNAMGGREVGGLANMLACHLGFSDKERNAVSAFWETDRLCVGPGLKAVDLFDAVHSGQIKFLWVMATNPAVSMPNAGKVREALAKCPTVVVSDVMADTDTGRFADIKLPALAWGEKAGTVTNSDRMVSRQRALFKAPGEAQADWKIIVDVAAAMGFAEHFDFSSPAGVFREYCAMTRLSVDFGRKLDMTAWAECSDRDYEGMAPFRWGGDHPLAQGYSTPSGNAQLVPVKPPSAKPAQDALPFRLNTARYRDQWHTMTRTGLSATLSHHRREPLIEVNPLDADNLDLVQGDLCKVTTTQGSSHFRVIVTKGVQRGAICTPMHWTDLFSNAGRTGRLASPDTDPISGQPGFKDEPATMEKVGSAWRAFMVCRDAAPVQTDYWVRSRVEGGWLYEMAGSDALETSGLLPHGLRSEVSYPERGMHRVCVSDEAGALIAALFVTRSGTLPSPDWVATQLGKTIENPAEILAARPRVPSPNRGQIICICHGVGDLEVGRAIEAGCSSVAEIGECTHAGTNCGSCRPILSRMIQEAATELKEAAE